MVRAWYMDNATGEQQHLENHRNPPEFISLDDLLKKTGVEYFEINVSTYRSDGVLNKIIKRRGYKYEEEIASSKELLPNNTDDKIKSFSEEHLHAHEEIRFVLEGSGYFDFRVGVDDWIRIAVSAGDMIVIPSGIFHRFTHDDTNNKIRVKLFYIGEPVWVPYHLPGNDKLYMLRTSRDMALIESLVIIYFIVVVAGRLMEYYGVSY